MSWTRFAVFYAIMITLTAGIHSYLWLRLVRQPNWPGPWFRILTWTLIALAVLTPFAMMASRIFSREGAAPFAWLGFIWMGMLFYLFLFVAGSDLIRLIAVPLSAKAAAFVGDPARREFLSRSIAGVTGVGTAALGLVGIWNARHSVQVKVVPVRLHRISKGTRPLRIIQLSDIHVGSTIGKTFIERIVAKTNALRPDIIAITGDLVDGSVEELGAHVAPLQELKAEYGVFFVTGNHEYYSGVEAWLDALDEMGIRVLRNERVTIRHDNTKIDLAGVDDWTAHHYAPGHGHDLDRALADRNPSRPVVLLAHQPKAFDDALRYGVDLQLSGHTHGGQIFPFGTLTRLVQPFLVGLHRREDSQIYVSPGTGYWGPPMRIGTQAEITLIELMPESVA